MRLKLLQERDDARRATGEALRARVRADLREYLSELLPGIRVIVFGSLIQPNRFHNQSDIDIALESEPLGLTRYSLTSELMERLGRPVDVLLLRECRFADKIRREGEIWTA